ncbi:MAG: hypothetical protein IH598_00935 [Bacteroidales bacterium]|nr:hypothetical protein [Bacteroidales bacterium]
MKKMKIKTIEDLRYRKLYLRSEIRVKEEKIIKNTRKFWEEIQTIDIKNDVIQGMINNPAMVINTARITYDIVSRIRRWRRNRKNRKT